MFYPAFVCLSVCLSVCMLATSRQSYRSNLHANYITQRCRHTSLFGCCSFRVCGPTIWNKLPLNLRDTDTREQFKHCLKGWLFECAYDRRRVWQTLTEGAPYKWTYLLTYLFIRKSPLNVGSHRVLPNVRQRSHCKFVHAVHFTLIPIISYHFLLGAKIFIIFPPRSSKWLHTNYCKCMHRTNNCRKTFIHHALLK